MSGGALSEEALIVIFVDDEKYLWALVHRLFRSLRRCVGVHTRKKRGGVGTYDKGCVPVVCDLSRDCLLGRQECPIFSSEEV